MSAIKPWVQLLPIVTLVLASCDCGDGSGSDDGGGSTADGSIADGAVVFRDAVIPADAPGSELCEGACACTDGVDNDADGLIDGMDPECTGPFDNDESSFATGIPGDNVDPKWQDCFFDGNSGAGDDGCRYHTDCLTGDRDPGDPDCQVSEMCRTFCSARTPNGCDCFGCCEVSLDDGSTVNIMTIEGCSIETISDESACPRCVPTTACGNECGTCELCPGRTEEDLPPECAPEDTDGGMPMYTCENGTTCASDADCPAGDYCSLGCCLAGLI